MIHWYSLKCILDSLVFSFVNKMSSSRLGVYKKALLIVLFVFPVILLIIINNDNTPMYFILPRSSLLYSKKWRLQGCTFFLFLLFT